MDNIDAAPRHEAGKPDYVKKIESFDMQNLTPEDIEFMMGTIQDYFKKKFPVRSELVDGLSERIVVLDAEEYNKARSEMGDRTDIDLEEMGGFYDAETNTSYIDISKHETPGNLFVTMFHEGLHAVSIGAGAGLRGSFSYPEWVDEHEDIRSQIDTGVRTLVEGTTQLITLSCVIDDMGFSDSQEMYSYGGECALMDTVWAPFPKEDRLRLYFETPVEDLRIHIEKTFEPEETRGKIGPEYSNAMYSRCLADLGVATMKLYEAVEDGGDSAEVLADARHAVGLYLVRDRDNKKETFDADEMEELADYLEPYIISGE